jgi:hypothetical protein
MTKKGDEGEGETGETGETGESAGPAIQGADQSREAGGKKKKAAEPGGLAAGDRRRIETLFSEAERDRSRALALKAELDRLGVFERYEDRFLDLFRSGS